VNLCFLGDALDHWKGSLFELLQRSDLLCDFAVDPLASDLKSWQTENFEVFARLLRVEQHQIVFHHASLDNREEYFREIRHKGDLFLDPDTGVATGRVKEKSQYVTPEEVRLLLNQSDRMLAVYQHVRAKATSERVNEVGLCLQQAISNLHWVSYESANVAMIFFSHSTPRLGQVAGALRKFLGSAASRRVRICKCEAH
jgi:hypothetical protein